MALRLQGQVFGSMAALTTFAGAGKFWELLTPEFKQKYANDCRTHPAEKRFELAKWVGDENIQAALAEYQAEVEAEKLLPENAMLDY